VDFAGQKTPWFTVIYRDFARRERLCFSVVPGPDGAMIRFGFGATGGTGKIDAIFSPPRP